MRLSFRLSEYEAEALKVAAGMWPEHANNTSELIRQILADWQRIRDSNGTTTRTQIAERLAAIEAMLQELLRSNNAPDY